jgi:hypothetical protein
MRLTTDGHLSALIIFNRRWTRINADVSGLMEKLLRKQHTASRVFPQPISVH